jgi:trk system potassium uptake protein TrkH
MNRRVVAYLVGHILLIEAVVMIPALIISICQQEQETIAAFGITIAITAGASVALLQIRPKNKTFHAAEGFVVTALSWIVISIFGALPFLFSGFIPNYIDCLFEVVSGFTTTGASILTNVEGLSMGLLYWRSFTHWLGGMGVLVFLLAVVSVSKGSGYSLHLLRAESPGPDVGKLTPKLMQSAKLLYFMYIILTIIEIIFLLAGGMPVFDSFCTAFGTAGTGGFAVKNDSMAGYSHYLQTVVTIFMALFGINFNIYFLLLIRSWKQLLHDEELWGYLGIMLGSILLITCNIAPVFQYNWGEALHQSAFQVSSVMTTTGFSTIDYNVWPQFSRGLLVMLMVLGASAGSTGGGVKIARIIILFKSLQKELIRMLHPRAVRAVRISGKIVDNKVGKGVNVFMAAYFAVFSISFLLVSIDNLSLETNATAVIACLSNIGPGLDLVGPMGNYSGFSNFSKLILTADMLFGRLEFFPMILLFSPSIWRRRPKPLYSKAEH